VELRLCCRYRTEQWRERQEGKERMNYQHGARQRSNHREHVHGEHRSNVAAVLIVLAGLALVAQAQLGTSTVSVSLQFHGVVEAGSHVGSGAWGFLPLP